MTISYAHSGTILKSVLYIEATERSKQGTPLFIGNIFYVNE